MEPVGRSPKAAGQKKTGNCRGPGTQEEMLIQLIGDPDGPAVPKGGFEYQRW